MLQNNFSIMFHTKFPKISIQIKMQHLTSNGIIINDLNTSSGLFTPVCDNRDIINP